MPNLLSGQRLRSGGSGQFISLPNAQPALGPSPSTGTGYTLITTPTGITSYASSLGNIQFSQGSLTNYIPGQDISIYVSSTGSLQIYAPTVFNNTVLFKNTFTFTDLEATGHVRFTGGFGSTSYTTGTLVVTGGVGISENLYVNQLINASQVFDDNIRVIRQVITGKGLGGGGYGPVVSLTNTGVTSLTAGTGTFVSTTTGDVVVWTYGNTLQDVLRQGNSATINAYFYNTTNATTAGAAAIVISGGLGVGKDVIVGGKINSTNILTSALTATNAVFTTTVINGLASSTSTLRNNALYVAGGAGIQTDLAVGNDAVIYGNLTVLGTATQVVYNIADVGRKIVALSTSAGPSLLSIDSGITVGPIAAPFAKFLFDGNSSWKSTGNIIPSMNNTYNLGSIAYQWNTVYSQTARFGSAQSNDIASGAVIIDGGIGIGGNTYIGGLTRVTDTTSATSTLTGALQVQGGVGIQGDLYARNFFDGSGSELVTTSTIGKYGIVSVEGRTDTAVSTSGGIVSIWNISTLQSITNRGPTTDRAVTFFNVTESDSTLTGAVIISGGLGVGKTVYATNVYSGGSPVVTTGTIASYAVTRLTAGTDTAVSTSTGPVVVWNTSTLHSITGRGNSTTNNLFFYSTLTVTRLIAQTTSSFQRDIAVAGISLFGTSTVYRGIGSSTAINSQTVRVLGGGVGVIGDSYINGNFGGSGNISAANKMYAGGAEVVTTATINNLVVSTLTAGTDTAVSTATGNVRVWVTATFQSITNRGSTTTNAIRIQNSTVSRSTITGALIVAGGVGIGGNLYVASTSYINGAQIITTATIAQYSSLTRILAGTDTAVNTSTGIITIWNTSTFQSITNRGSTTSNIINITNTTTSLNTATGALVISGGVGIGDNINVANTSYIHGAQIITTATIGDYVTRTVITAGTDTAVSTSTGIITIWNTSTFQSITNRGSVTTNNIKIANTSQSLAALSSNALEVSGGIGVAGSALVKGGATIAGNTIIQGTSNSVFTNSTQALLVSGGIGVAGNLSAGKLYIADTTRASAGGAGSARIAGGAYVGGNLVVTDTAASTSTYTANALYVAGGVGINSSLFVRGNTTFGGNVTFNGTATYVYSINSYYTDNMIELHVPQRGVGSPWELDDGQDIGLRFHYYKDADKNAGLFLSNVSGYLEWINDGAENLGTEQFTGSYGTFKSGSVILSDTTVAEDIYIPQRSQTGSLIVGGGTLINKNLIVSGTLGADAFTATIAQSVVVGQGGIGVRGDSFFNNTVGIGQNLIVGSNASTGYLKFINSDHGIYFRENEDNRTNYYEYGGLLVEGLGHNFYTGGIKTDQQLRLAIADDGVRIPGDLYVDGVIHAIGIGGGSGGVSTTATNLAGGATGSIPYQLDTDLTGFIGIGPNGTLLQSNGLTATWVTFGNIASSTATYANNVLVSTTENNLDFYPTFVSRDSTYSLVYSDTDLKYNPLTNIFTVGGSVIITGFDQATTTTDSGVLQVAGGASVAGNLYANRVFDGAARVVSSVSPTAGTGIDVIIQNLNGPRASFTIINTGVVSLQAGTDTQVSTSTGEVTIWSTSTLQSVTDRGSDTTNQITIYNTLESSNTYTGALTVVGGVAIGKSLNVQRNIQSNSDGIFLGQITAGTTMTAGIQVISGIPTVGIPVTGYVSNNIAIASYTSDTIGSTGTQNLDYWDSAIYRTAKYLIQITDLGYDPVRVHSTELMLIHDGSTVYSTEYGIMTNKGILGTFDASITGGNVVLAFTPNSTNLLPNFLTIKVSRTSITI